VKRQTIYGRLVERYKRRLIRLVLKKTHGKVAPAARILGIARTTLWDLLKHFGIDPRAYRL
jgi:DNA-binding NtrC family response regulator